MNNLTTEDIVYISGPMTGLPQFNFPAFDAMEATLKERINCKVLNPTRYPEGLEYEDYMDLAFEDIEKATALVMLDGWVSSSGARREHFKAMTKKLKIISQKEIEDLEDE